MNALLSRARIDVVSNAKKKTHVARSSSCTIRFSARVSTAAASLFVFATRKLARAILVSSNVLFSNCVVSRQLCVNAFTARVLCKPHREDDGRDHQKTGGSINATTTLDDETRLLDVCSAYCTRVNFARGPKMVVFPYTFRTSHVGEKGPVKSVAF